MIQWKSVVQTPSIPMLYFEPPSLQAAMPKQPFLCSDPAVVPPALLAVSPPVAALALHLCLTFCLRCAHPAAPHSVSDVAAWIAYNPAWTDPGPRSARRSLQAIVEGVAWIPSNRVCCFIGAPHMHARNWRDDRYKRHRTLVRLSGILKSNFSLPKLLPFASLSLDLMKTQVLWLQVNFK